MQSNTSHNSDQLPEANSMSASYWLKCLSETKTTLVSFLKNPCRRTSSSDHCTSVIRRSEVPDWNSLLIEMKREVVGYLGHKDRLALRSCSRMDRNIVDSVPFKTVEHISIKETENEWQFQLTRKPFGHVEKSNRVSFETMQSRLTAELKGVLHIRVVELNSVTVENFLQLAKTAKVLSIGKLILDRVNWVSTMFPMQVVPLDVKCVEFVSDDSTPELYDIPQIINAEFLRVYYCYINDQQLLKLKARNFDSMFVHNLTVSGINQFIQKFIKRPDFLHFRFHGLHDLEGLFNNLDINLKMSHDDTAIVNTSFVGVKLEMKVTADRDIIGRRIELSDDQLDKSCKFRKASSIGICYLQISKNETSFYREDVKCFLPSQVEEKLVRLANSYNYIKILTIVQELSEKFDFSSLPSNMAVGIVHLNSLISIDKVIVLLEKVDVKHFKGIVSIANLLITDIVFDVECVKLADIIRINSCSIRDDQLLKLNATQLFLDNNPENKLTAAGLHEFLKKCLLELNKKDYNIQLKYCDYETNSEKIYDAFPLFSTSTIEERETSEGHVSHSRLTLVPSKFRGFELKIFDNFGKVTVSRERSSNF